MIVAHYYNTIVVSFIIGLISGAKLSHKGAESSLGLSCLAFEGDKRYIFITVNGINRENTSTYYIYRLNTESNIRNSRGH